MIDFHPRQILAAPRGSGNSAPTASSRTGGLILNMGDETALSPALQDVAARPLELVPSH